MLQLVNKRNIVKVEINQDFCAQIEFIEDKDFCNYQEILFLTKNQHVIHRVSGIILKNGYNDNTFKQFIAKFKIIERLYLILKA